MIKKEIFIGFVVGIISNTIGTLLYILIFSQYSIKESFKVAHEGGHLGSVLALGAILNLFAFFGFLKIRRDHRAKGVLIATMLSAFIILIYKIL
ncbi:hypothetical protein [Abyssalbus ytuae]|uniref:Uncharacterized protein n=1 Tax=Abyssalbus ytuae TaxID=2926907 RepID=A0A9E7CUN2_9FLAO|nr:hypothetical protein [Abyssalbus ytuae]UOB18717.1 hypothetical protein MQE35_05350 [Abyssalbus ytuae]